jgi:hypothetical protein
MKTLERKAPNINSNISEERRTDLLVLFMYYSCLYVFSNLLATGI